MKDMVGLRALVPPYTNRAPLVRKEKVMSSPRWQASWCGLLMVLIGPPSAMPAADGPAGQPNAPQRPTAVSLASTLPPGQATVRVDADCDAATLPWLSWDTEGGDRAKNNLLRAGVSLRKCTGEKVVALAGKGEKTGPRQVTFRFASSPTPMDWIVRIDGSGLSMQLSGGGAGAHADRTELAFPFNPLMVATTLLPARWEADGSLRLPAIISARTSGRCC